MHCMGYRIQAVSTVKRLELVSRFLSRGHVLVDVAATVGSLDILFGNRPMRRGPMNAAYRSLT
jgi:hypothetical protein